MAKIDSSLKNMLLSLGLITIVAAGLLGGVYVLTADKIAETELNAQIAAISEVAPEFDNNPLEEFISSKVGVDSLIMEVYPARNDGKLVGAAVKSVTNNGFSGEIVIMFGFNEDGSVKNYRVLKHAETAGLGSKMQEWFSESKGTQSILGLNPAKNNMRVSKDGGDVDAITAATITSRAFLDALNNAHAAYMELYKNEMEAQSNE